MTLEVSSIVDFLTKNPCQKAKTLAVHLGVTRREINVILYSNPDSFIKNSDHEWSCKKTEVLDRETHPYLAGSVLEIQGIDIVERLKDELRVNPHQKIQALEEKFPDSRRIIYRTLISYRDIFAKNHEREWFIEPSYTDNTIGPDADFEEAVEDTVSRNHLPVADFSERGRPTKQTVIEATLDRNFLVLAPPGTGKTYTLIERLVHCISNSTSPGDAGKMLVLSFTRAAVGEIRERVSKAIVDGAPNSLRYVRIQTFDAYATWLLNDGGYDISGSSYDARISLLTENLTKVRLRQATGRVDRSRYLFIDEIQDLVGVRADMVFELVKRVLASRGSVTLLGDPNQSLNDYQLKGMQTGSAEFLDRVRAHLNTKLEELELKESHRYETPEMKELASKAKMVLDESGLSPVEKYEGLVGILPSVGIGSLASLESEDGFNALLCRTNAELYQWFNWLVERGHCCLLNAGSNSRPWPAWIGETVLRYQAKSITRERFLERLKRLESTGFSNSEQVLDNFLSGENLIRGGTINIEEMAFRLRYYPPASKNIRKAADLVVSTVHKAKGLEYRNVVVIEPSSREITDEEVRVLYVAITRAKRSIFLLPRSETPFTGYIRKCKGGHLRYGQNGKKYLQVIGDQDFDLETLFIRSDGLLDIDSLEKYLQCSRVDKIYSIRPECPNGNGGHYYALFLTVSPGVIRLCAVGGKLNESLNAMAWGNNYADDGAFLDIGSANTYQSIVHPVESHHLDRHLGRAGILVFPNIEGFYPLSRAIGEQSR